MRKFVGVETNNLNAIFWHLAIISDRQTTAGRMVNDISDLSNCSSIDVCRQSLFCKHCSAH